ncbi:ATP-dependent RNA helicase DBP4 [Symbiodinium microadriaticum]|uniref:ATP-dependent RNA helicase n=1 Tax=Symbiodinium microadriaticum TaxID=2951 RepID=A0A1Q9D8Y7_SYMMI|nr:ATP-dependent RNA helicase DBP4 [Symbiodinium microadriaticum]
MLRRLSSSLHALRHQLHQGKLGTHIGLVKLSSCDRPNVFAETTFADFPLDERLRRGLEAALGKSYVTPVQHEVFSRHLTDKEQSARQADLLLQAPTGTGKTIAFLLPALQRLLLLEDARRAGKSVPEGVLTLVVAPTRELVLQSAKIASRLLQFSGGQVRSSFVAGSFSLEEDISRLREDMPQLLFATPWRLAHGVAQAEALRGACGDMPQHGAPLVELKMMSGDSLCLELGATALIQDLKSEVFRLRGIPPDCQRILQGSQALSDLSEVQDVCTPGSEPLSLVVCLDHILQNLETDSILITIRSLDLLSRLLPAGSLEVFRSYLTHSHEDVRRTAMRALLRSLPAEETTPLILQGIKDQSGEVRQDAMEALRTTASTALLSTQAEHAEHALRAALDGCMDVLVPVRIAAVRALQALVVPGVNSQCIAGLQARVGDANSLVREEALDALRQLESENMIAPGSVAEALEKLELECKEWDTWLWALRAEKKLSLQERAWKILDRLSDSGAERAQKAEVEAVEEVPFEGIAVESKCDLMVMLCDALREALLEGLQGGSELFEKTFSCIAAAFGDSSARVRGKAAEVLLVCCKSCRHEALALLTKGLGDASLGVRERVAELLSELLSADALQEAEGRAVLEALKDLLSEPSEQADSARKVSRAISVLAVLERLGPSLGAFAKEGLQLAVSLLEDPAPDVRGAALVAISTLDTVGTVSAKAVQASFCDPDAAVRSVAWALRETLHSSGDNIDVDAFVSGLGGGSVDSRCLRDFLQEARPTWSERELSAVLMKLQEVGVTSIAELEQSLPRMNTLLSTAGLRCFSRETLSLLRCHLVEKGDDARHLQTTPHFVNALQSVDLLVLDEADRLLDPSFVYKVDYLIRCLPTPRPRMVLCSATFSEPLRKFAIRSLRANLEVIRLGSKEPSPGEANAEVAEVAAPVQQVLVRYKAEEFLTTLHATLEHEMGQEGQMRRVLVVFPTVRWLQFFYVLLKHRAHMSGLFALHRSLSDDRRRARALRFSRGAPASRGALFATDLASRGMDFDVHAVIQVGPPSDREQYVHRAGRTGRLASQGRSVLLLNPVELTVLKELGTFEEEQVQASVSSHQALSSMHGWWEDASLSASGHLFFASAIAFYLNESQRLRARAVDVVQTVAALLQSTGLPQDYGLPAIPRGLAARLREKDELVAVRTETVRERWDVLSALGPGTMRKTATNTTEKAGTAAAESEASQWVIEGKNRNRIRLRETVSSQHRALPVWMKVVRFWYVPCQPWQIEAELENE